MSINSIVKDLLLYALFIILVYLFFFGTEETIASLGMTITEEWRKIFVVFLGILLEALPFIILGAIASSGIQLFMTEDTLRKLIPQTPMLAMLVALLAAVITPICECAIIPVVRRLIQKGVPVHAATVILLGAPILNFVVFGSTYFAFENNPSIYIGRFVLCIVTALIIGALTNFFFSKRSMIKIRKEDLLTQNSYTPPDRGTSKLKGMIHHASHEFFEVGKYFLLGAFLASIAQVYLERSVIVQAAVEPLSGTAMMMGFAFLLSLCSEADAFVAASFERIFPVEAILAFLVYGPLLDLKNSLVMFSYFKVRFVLFYMAAVTIVVYSLSLIAGKYVEGVFG
ncbi:MAG TPA: permease [Chondromyces sp.]|nr:permease [Chondromyces sp.]